MEQFLKFCGDKKIGTMENYSLKDQIKSDFQVFEQNLNGNAVKPFHQVRKAAFDTFEQLGFPTNKHEEWKYSNVKELAGKSFNFHSKSNRLNKCVCYFIICTYINTLVWCRIVINNYIHDCRVE